jgi:hypothetical protein
MRRFAVFLRSRARAYEVSWEFGRRDARPRIDRHPKKDGRDVDRTGNHSSCPGKSGTDALGVSGVPARLQETEHAISHHSRL